MEDRRNRTSEELATPEKELRGFGISRRCARNSEAKKLKRPSVNITLENEVFSPGDCLLSEYEVKQKGPEEITAVETSVIWLTEGKGEENIGVHFFERRQQSLLNSGAFDTPQRISTILPASPLSYEGDILKIRWAVRVRLFLGNGEQITEDKLFTLGNIQSFSTLQVDADSKASDVVSE